VSFFGDGGRSASPFFPFFFGDLDLFPGLSALLSPFFPLADFAFSYVGKISGNYLIFKGLSFCFVRLAIVGCDIFRDVTFSGM
jgi:hypothetical protein